MVSEQRCEGPDLGPMLGMAGEDVRSRLGSPRSDRSVGCDRWLVYRSDGWGLRLRLAPLAAGTRPVVRSWTLELRDGGAELRPLLERLGLRPAGAVESAPGAEGRLLRCAISSPAGEASVTAAVLAGRIASVTAFDEAPDWTPEGRD